MEIFGSELSVLTRTPTQGRVAKMPAAAVKGELQCTNRTIWDASKTPQMLFCDQYSGARGPVHVHHIPMHKSTKLTP